MPNSKKSATKRILIDILGVSMMVAAPLIGWLPGPGGIPLFLGGLALLAQNHVWARNLLKKLKSSGSNALELFFPQHPAVRLLYDLFSIGLVVLGVWVLKQELGNYRLALSTMIFCIAIALLLGNKQRIKRLTLHLKRST